MQPPETVDRQRIMVYNMALTGLFATTRSLLEGNIDSPRDALRTFAFGAAAGYGFYQAKQRLGEDQRILGTLLAYSSASVTENTALGEHPLSHLRLGPGFIDARLRTPLASHDEPRLTLEVNPVGTASLLVLPFIGFEPVFRGGTLTYDSGHSLGQEGYYMRSGMAFSRAIVLSRQASERVVAHELIHFFQALQIQAVTPYPTLGSIKPDWTFSSADGQIRWDLQTEWLYGAFSVLNHLSDYQNRWVEIEAYTLQDPRSVSTEESGCQEGICLLGQ